MFLLLWDKRAWKPFLREECFFKQKYHERGTRYWRGLGLECLYWRIDSLSYKNQQIQLSVEYIFTPSQLNIIACLGSSMWCVLFCWWSIATLHWFRRTGSYSTYFLFLYSFCLSDKYHDCNDSLTGTDVNWIWFFFFWEIVLQVVQSLRKHDVKP